MTQVTTVKKQLNESQESQNKGDNKLSKCMQNLRVLQDEKGSLEAKLGQKTIALQSQVRRLLFFLKTNCDFLRLFVRLKPYKRKLRKPNT